MTVISAWNEFCMWYRLIQWLSRRYRESGCPSWNQATMLKPPRYSHVTLLLGYISLYNLIFPCTLKNSKKRSKCKYNFLLLLEVWSCWHIKFGFLNTNAIFYDFTSDPRYECKPYTRNTGTRWSFLFKLFWGGYVDIC